MERLWTVYEAEAERGIPYATLLRLIHAGDLPAVKLRGRRRYLIDRADLDALIQASKTTGRVDQKVDQTPVMNAENSQQNHRPRKMVKSAEFVVKPNWYKKLTPVD